YVSFSWGCLRQCGLVYPQIGHSDRGLIRERIARKHGIDRIAAGRYDYIVRCTARAVALVHVVAADIFDADRYLRVGELRLDKSSSPARISVSHHVSDLLFKIRDGGGVGALV